MKVARALLGEEASIVFDRNFQLILLANIPAFLGIVVVSPILDSLIEPFGATEASIGLLVTAYTAPAIVIIPLSGYLTDRLGRKPALIAGLILFGTGGSAIALTTSFWVALGLRLIQGAGFAFITPVLITCIGDLYSGAEETTGQGLRIASSGISQATFPVVAGLLVVVAWQYPFLLFAIALPLAAVVYARFEEPADRNAGSESKANADESAAKRTEDEPTTKRKEDETAAEDNEDETVTGSPADDDDGSYLRELLFIAGQRRVFPIVIAVGVPVFVYVGFLTYNSLVVVTALGGTPGQAGLLITVISVIYAVAATQAGRAAAAFETETVPLVTSNLSLGGGMVLVGAAPTLWLAAVGSALLGFGFGLSISMYRSLITGFVPVDYRGGLVSVGETSGRVAATVSPVAMGIVIGLGEGTIGSVPALRWAMIGTGIVGASVGVACTLIAMAAPPVSVPGESDSAAASTTND